VSKCISVVIPYYNASRFILKAVNSVKNQTLRPKELIVIDDGSSDNVEELLKELDYPFDFRLLKNKTNKGRSFSRNLGVKEATCPFVAFLDADDMYDKYHLEVLSSQEADIAYDIVRTFIDEDDDIIRISKKSYKGSKSMILGGLVGYPSSMMVKKDTFLGFDESLHQREDWELFLRYYKYGLSINILDKNSAFIREHSKRTSRSKDYFLYTMKVYETYKDLECPDMWLSISETAFRFKEKTVGFEFLIKALKQNPFIEPRRAWNIIKRIPKI